MEQKKGNVMKRIMTIIFCIALCVQVAFADSEVIDDVTWYYSTYSESGRIYAQVTSGANKYSGNLTVPSALGGYEVKRIGHDAFRDCGGLLTIALPNTVTHIDYQAFLFCFGLTHAIIPDSVVGMNFGAFQGCSSLESVVLSQNLSLIPYQCFADCSRLKEIDFPAGLKVIEYSAFSGCAMLANFVLPEGLESIGASAFYNCDALSCIDIPSTVNAIGSYVIRGCDNLKEITVANANGSYKVLNNCLVSYDGKTLLAVPFGCSTVNIPQGITAIPEGMFQHDGNLVAVTIPHGVSAIGQFAFDDCNNLVAVDVPVGCMTIGRCAFQACTSLVDVSLPDGLVSIDYGAFISSFPSEIILPASVTTVGSYAFGNGNCSSRRVVLLGEPPIGIADSRLLYSNNISFPREHGAAWMKLLNDINKVNGYYHEIKPEVEYVLIAARERDPTVLDVVYRVRSAKSTVKVRALAFKDGVRSFSNVVRPATFIEGTDINLGDSIVANVEHKLSWRVSTDWQIDLAKVKFEVLVVEEDLLPLELITIPENGTNCAMEISWNALSSAQVFDALLWLYADGDAGLALMDGVLKNGDNIVAYGTNVSTVAGRSRQNVNGTSDYYYFALSTAYVFSKMGFSVLEGDALTYAKGATRLELSPSGVRQYAYRWIDAQQ